MTNEELNKIPEKTVVLKGESLQTLRHMPVPPNLTAAIRGPKDPFHLYEILKEEYPPNHPLKLVLGDSERAIHLSDLNTEEDLFKNVHFLVIPPLPDGSAFETFQNTVARLRGPNGCPWDRKQTHQSLRDDLLQEVYELLDGLDRSNMAAVTEELGDVLLHILLQAQIGVDNGEFTMAEVLTHVNDKIISRHAHVFGNPENMSPDQVMVRWEQIKQKEREKQHKTGGMLDGISKAMPALSQANAYQKRASKAGFDWENTDGIRQKLAEELREFEEADSDGAREEELGDLLFSVVNLARKHKIDPETSLRMASLKFYKRLHYVESRAAEQGKDLFELSDEEKLSLWNEAKKSIQNMQPGN